MIYNPPFGLLGVVDFKWEILYSTSRIPHSVYVAVRRDAIVLEQIKEVLRGSYSASKLLKTS